MSMNEIPINGVPMNGVPMKDLKEQISLLHNFVWELQSVQDSWDDLVERGLLSKGSISHVIDSALVKERQLSAQLERERNKVLDEKVSEAQADDMD